MKKDNIKMKILDWSQPFVLCKRQRLMGGVEPYTYTHTKKWPLKNMFAEQLVLEKRLCFKCEIYFSYEDSP